MTMKQLVCFCSAAFGEQRTQQFCIYQPRLQCDLQHFMLPQRCICVGGLCVRCAELHGCRRSSTCAGVCVDNDVPIFLDMRGQISITADVTGGSSLESSVDRLSQGLRSGLADGWRAVLLLQAGSSQLGKKEPSRLHVLDVLKLHAGTAGRLCPPL